MYEAKYYPITYILRIAHTCHSIMSNTVLYCGGYEKCIKHK